MANAAELAIILRAVDELTAPLAKAGGSLSAFANAAAAPSRALGGLGGAIEGVAKAGIGLFGLKEMAGGIADIAHGMVAGNAEMETYQTQLGTLMGSADAAKERLAELAKFGAETPFELPEVVRAEKVLLGFGLTGQKALDLTGKNAADLRTIVGDIAAGTGASFEEIALNFGKFSAGATGEAISRFQELGIVTREQMAAMGVQFSKSGELVSPLPEAMQAAVAIAQGKFGGGMATLSKTFEGQMSTLADNFNQAKNAIMAPIFDVLRDSLAGANAVLSSGGFQEALSGVASLIAGGVSKAIGTASVAFTGLQALIAAFTTDAGAMGIVLDMIRKLFGDAVADAIEPFVQAFMQAIPQIKVFAEQVWTLIQGVGNVVSDVLSGDIGVAFDDLREGVMLTGQDLVAQLAQWAQAFLGWIGPMIPPLLHQLEQVWEQVYTWLYGTALPALVRTLGTWAGAFIDWVAPLIPPLLHELGQLLSDMLGFLVDTALPLLLRNLVEWGQAFVDWVAPRIPPLLVELGKLLVEFGGWILSTAAPAIVQHLVAWGNAFVEWVGPQIPPLLVELGKLLLALGGWIKDTALPALVETIKVWVPAFLDWVGTDLVPKIPPTLKAMLDAIGTWLKDTAVPWAEENLPKLGSAMVSAIGSAFSALGGALQQVFQQIKVDVGPFHLSAAGFSIDAPKFPDITLPSFGIGGQRGPGGSADTVAQSVAALVADGLDPNLVAREVGNICGPLAAEGILRGLGGAVNIAQVEAKARGIGAYVPGQGFKGPWMMQSLLGAFGIGSTVTQDVAAAQRAAGAGLPVGISTPNHWYMADAFANGQWDVGNSGLAIGGGRSMSFESIRNFGGGFQAFVIPALQRGADAADAFEQSLGDVELQVAALPESFGITNQAVEAFADKTGMSWDMARNQLEAFEYVAQQSLNTKLPEAVGTFTDAAQQALTEDVPLAISITDQAVEQFADRTHMSWDDARAWLEQYDLTSGQVLTEGLPYYLQVSDQVVEAFAAKHNLTWDEARAVLEHYGSLADTVLGLNVPADAAAAGTALAGDNGLAAQATKAATKIGDVTTSATNLQNPLDLAKSAVGGLGTEMAAVATNQATQIAAVLLQLRDGLLGLGEYAGAGLIDAVQTFIDTLGKIPSQVSTTIRVATEGGAALSSGAGGAGGGGGGQVEPGTRVGDTPGTYEERQHLRDQGYYVDDSGVYAMAGGGITTGPMLALVGDNPSGREAVIPLDRGGLSLSDDTIRKLASAIAERVPTSVAVQDVAAGLRRLSVRNGGLALG